MIHIKLAGNPYEIGHQHGRALRPLVDAMVRYESRRHTHLAPEPLDLAGVEGRVQRLAPELLVELRGIAAGAGVPYPLLLEMNLRILHFCTVVAFPQAAEGPLLGKNLDFPLYAYQALFSVEPDGGYAFGHVGCAGSVASYGGLNAAGLAMGHAAVPLEDAGASDGLPVAFLRRLALQHNATTAEAIAWLAGHEAWRIGDNLLFLDRSGEAVVVELEPGAQRLRRPEGGALWCSNCFADLDRRAGHETGRGRHRSLARLLDEPPGLLDRTALQRLLGSHNGPYPICRDSTQLSFVANPASGDLAIADGYPCQVGYQPWLEGENSP